MTAKLWFEIIAEVDEPNLGQAIAICRTALWNTRYVKNVKFLIGIGDTHQIIREEKRD
ncbi:MAG: hypothetical protein WC489_06375 [Patescibacteria group bacterium]|jgi:hypothetical protein